LPSVPLTYVLGTVGIIAILGVVALVATEVGTSINADATQSELTDAAQYVASELNTIAATAANSQGETVVFRIVIPHELSLNGYAVNLTSDSYGWKVVAYLPFFTSTQATARLYFNATGSTTSPGLCVYLPPSNPGGCSVPPPFISPQAFLYSGDSAAAVWASGNRTLVTVGLGDFHP
jgi:hypothetical protein